MSKKSRNILYMLVLTLFFGGCANTSKMGDGVVQPTAKAPVANTAILPPVANTATLPDLMAEAASATSAGKPDKASAILNDAAKLFPADKKPWVQMAQIEFDRANYGEAIMKALEALQRDQKDQVANSIVAVSGLRLSTKALADLSQQNDLSGSVKTEAQDLAKLLRESLGETALVPPPEAKPVEAPPIKPKRSTRTKAPRGSTVRPPATTETDSGGSPFGALR